MMTTTTTRLFDREGIERRPNAHNEKGQPLFCYSEARKCSRCGGAGGSDGWRHTGWTCFDCGGSGLHKNGPRRITLKLYSAEKNAALDRAKAKRAETKARKAAEREAAEQERRDKEREEVISAHAEFLAKIEPFADESEFLGSLRDQVCEESKTLSERQIEAGTKAAERLAERELREEARSHSEFVGEIGERIEFRATLSYKVCVYRVRQYEPGSDRYLHVFDTSDGNVIVMFGATLGRKQSREDGGTEWVPLELDGPTVLMRGTVKEHKVYKGVNQTVVNRMQIREDLPPPTEGEAS